MAKFSLFRRYNKIKRKIQLFINERIKKSVYTKDVLINQHLAVGDFTYGKPEILIFPNGETADVNIGKFCSIAPEVKIFTGGNHKTNWVSSYPFNQFVKDFPTAAKIKGQPWSKGSVSIGNDVWIGQGAVILSGVTIGDGAVIGANCVVAKNVEPYQIVVGNPMVKLKKRFDDSIIEQLLIIKWWDWNIEKIKDEAENLSSDRIQNFINKHKNKV